MTKIIDYLRAFEEEYIQSFEKHGPMKGEPVHDVGVMVEEAGEAMRAALQYADEGGSLSAIRHELIQTGAMALKALECFDDQELPERIADGT